MKHLIAPLFLSLFVTVCTAKTWQVGPGRTYTVPSKVIGLVADGDSVAIDAATYAGDVGEWTKNNLVIYCPNGRAVLNANGQISEQKGIWVVSGNNTSIEGVEFYGAAISVANGNNGAGIRMQGTGLTLRNCYFHDNQDGILTGAGATSDIVIEACEFAKNGAGDGYSHNMYIGNVRSFTLKYCYVHEASVGHEVKTRANNNFILYNVIVDDASTSSYDIDMPNGGFSIVEGNSIMKGPNAQNRVLVNFGEEGLKNPDSTLYVINNTMVSTHGASTVFIQVAAGTKLAQARNNIFAGAGSFTSGTVDLAMSAASNDTSSFHFMDVTHDDYRLTTPYAGMHAGVDPGSVNGNVLLPTSQYLSPLDSALRSDDPPAIGAFSTAGQSPTLDFFATNVDFGTIHTDTTYTMYAYLSCTGPKNDVIVSVSCGDPEVTIAATLPLVLYAGKLSPDAVPVLMNMKTANPNFITYGHFVDSNGMTFTDTLRANVAGQSSVSFTERDPALIGNSPNPFSRSTSINVPSAYEGQSIRVEVYNSIGMQEANVYQSVSNGRINISRGALRDGVYFYRVVTLDSVEFGRGRMVVVSGQ
jgi:hypothetical protein